MILQELASLYDRLSQQANLSDEIPSPGWSMEKVDQAVVLNAQGDVEGVLQLGIKGKKDQLQPLDLGIFANQKRWQGNITVDADLNRQTKQVIKICDSYRMATTHKNVVSAFRRAGFPTQWNDTTLTLMVDVDIRYATALRDEDDEMMPIDRQGKQRVRI